jgi:hypothetical protein
MTPVTPSQPCYEDYDDLDDFNRLCRISAEAMFLPQRFMRYMAKNLNIAEPGFWALEHIAAEHPFFGELRPNVLAIDADVKPGVQASEIWSDLETAVAELEGRGRECLVLKSGNQTRKGWHVFAVLNEPADRDRTAQDLRKRFPRLDVRTRTIRPPFGLHNNQVERSLPVSHSIEDAIELIDSWRPLLAGPAQTKPRRLVDLGSAYQALCKGEWAEYERLSGKETPQTDHGVDRSRVDIRIALHCKGLMWAKADVVHLRLYEAPSPKAVELGIGGAGRLYLERQWDDACQLWRPGSGALVLEKLGRIEALVHGHCWTGRCGHNPRAIVLAVVEKARSLKSLSFPMSHRELALACGLSHKTVGKLAGLGRLAPFVTVHQRSAGFLEPTTVWTLADPAVVGRLPTNGSNPFGGGGVTSQIGTESDETPGTHRLWGPHRLGMSRQLAYQAFSDVPIRVSEAHRRAVEAGRCGVKLGAFRKATKDLVEFGLLLRRPEGIVRALEVDLDALANDASWGESDEQLCARHRKRYEADRHLRQRWYERQGRPEPEASSPISALVVTDHEAARSEIGPAGWCDRCGSATWTSPEPGLWRHPFDCKPAPSRSDLVDATF